MYVVLLENPREDSSTLFNLHHITKFQLTANSLDLFAERLG